MHLTSFGAAETVTGSCHLLEVAGTRVLIDCGLYQGDDDLEALNREPFPFDVRSLDAVLLTHAHLDHVGRLPVLTRLGYRGPIYCTPATAALAGIVLLDSARLQVEDYRRDVRKARRVGEEDRVPEPLYDEDDVHTVQALLRPQLEFGETLSVGNVRVTPGRAGHILGSAYLLLDTPDGRLLMSGDLGNRESGLQQDFTLPPHVDVLVTETTYADRTHRPLTQTLAEFTDALQRSVARGGKILIPTFAIERTQAILYYLKHLMDAGQIPYVPVFLDSPMGARATHEYFEYGDELIPEVRDELHAGGDPFRPSTLHVVTTSAESQRLNRLEGSAIILAGNGMMSGGRIQHHLKHHLWKPDTSLVIVSYQSPHSLGGRIVAGEPTVRIMGEDIAVRAQVHTIGGFSAHADQDDLLAFVESAGNPKTWLVHGEVDVMTRYLDVLAARGVTGDIVPRAEAVDLRATYFPGGRPPGLPVGSGHDRRPDE
ncbi:MBL fold metallo-hydrolase RNA specificity domain-containing protein [Deinococcus maricopensis]|uniref:Beta-lactamase domain protein n=1 Tax=Deinococcus maricopensis (strain DSM 21211 / LMG 22137 / NRRL B-23946 / LB-34) TaxID=709986 RepID=E8U4K0_DEIML|nr:MBL fold metallo-hydrolase [Deinococcus maricopensis]ADV68865.1 beta-lactamase domain protein [Deinococcus maricopensis DSM 21211]